MKKKAFPLDDMFHNADCNMYVIERQRIKEIEKNGGKIPTDVPAWYFVVYTVRKILSGDSP